jgi:mRNA-degrading endonuclease RelE of RelBE toxin-antitoxin system
MAKKQLLVGVNEGAGHPPGYEWSVWFLSTARDDANRILSDPQYQHVVMQFQELAREVDPTHSNTCSVKAVDSYYEFRDKGGVLGKINIRVFFSVEKEHKAIVVLGTIKNEAEGKTPNVDKIRMARRQRKLRAGEYGTIE